MTFRIGQKVVCVAPYWTVNADPNVPQEGQVYTVRGKVDGGRFLYLREIRNPPRIGFEGCFEPCWSAKGFRPVVTRKTDISIFTDMLTPAPVREDA